MKKILIWNTFILHERSGGPSTYLHNLRKYTRSHNIENITYLNDSDAVPNKKPKIEPAKSIIPKLIRNSVRINQNLKKQLVRFQSPAKIASQINVDEFDVIHFHNTIDLFQAIPQLVNYKGKVILTSHTPMAPHLEYIGEVLPLNLIRSKTRKAFQNLDEAAFKRADVLLFPAKEALEPYKNTWSKFESIISDKQIYYVPTGVHEPGISRSRNEVLTEMGIPLDAIVLCYAGRHNHVKGYDLLKAFGTEILAKHPNCYFLILGKEDPIQGLEHERWKEVGWTTDPFSYIRASSMFILPNRETYFDLILIEILSLGKQCLLSRSGGNKHFIFLEKKGFNFFETNNLNSMIEAFEAIDFKEDHSTVLLETFEKGYTATKFGEGYMDFYESL